MADIWKLTEELMELDNAVWNDHGFQSRPSGEDRREYLEDVVSRLEDGGYDPDEIDDDVLEALEDENFHSLIDALMVFRGDETVEGLMEDECRWL